MTTLFAFVGFNEIIPLVVMAVVVASIFAGLTLMSNRNSRASDRLDRWSRPASLADIEDPRGNKKDRFAGIMETAKAMSKPLMPILLLGGKIGRQVGALLRHLLGLIAGRTYRHRENRSKLRNPGAKPHKKMNQKNC